MPAFITSPQQTQLNALYPGGRITLVNNAATDSGITKTLQFAIGPNPMGTNTINIINSTNQQATGQLAPNSTSAISPADGDFQPASSMIVPAGGSLPYNVAGGWCRFTFSVAPTSGSLVVER